MKELCLAYKRDLPNKISVILVLWKSLKEDSWNPERFSQLYYLVHNLAGSGTIFDCKDVSDIAACADELLYPFIKIAAEPNLKDKLAIDSVMRNLEEYSLPEF